jgi:hypothetical protein
MSDVPKSPNSNVVTSIFDRLIRIGWVHSYATDVHYRVQAVYTAEGVTTLSSIREALAKIGPLSDLELSALAWIIQTNLPK